MPLEERLTRVLDHACESLSNRWDKDLSLGQPVAFDDGHGAYRVPITSPSPDTPPTFVIKIYEIEEPNRKVAFGREAAGWAFLEEVAVPERPLPEYYGCDRDRGYVVLQDLYGWEKISMLLRGDWSTRIEWGERPEPSQDRQTAEDAMRAYWRALGQLHAATAGQEERYAAIRTSFCADISRPKEVTRTNADHIARFSHICEATGVTPTPGSETDLETALLTTKDPPFTTFLHGDAAPPNALYRESQCKLIDFEEGRYGGALSDAVHIHTDFHTSWCAGRLPDHLKEEIDWIYRKELAAAYPDILDDDVFYGRIADLSLIRVLGSWRPFTGTDLLQEDKGWGRATFRQRFLARLERAVYWTDRLGYLNRIGATFGNVLRNLTDKWPADVHAMPGFPALSD